MENINVREIRGRFSRVSWGSIFAGVLTALAISVLLSLLATSISLFMFNPTADDPTSGIGTNVGIWTVVSMLLSLVAGGFVAGKLAGTEGMIHGFLVWATSSIVTIILVVMLAVGAVKATANVLGAMSSVVGNVISGVGSAAASGTSAVADQIQDLFDNSDFNSNLNGYDNNLQQDIRTALRKSGVKEFQPAYLQNQMNQIKRDFNKTAKQIATHPKDAQSLMNGFLERLKNRADRFGQSISRQDVVKAISNNTNLSQAEVNQAADQYIDLYNQAVREGKQQIDNLQQTIQNAQQNWEQLKQQALQEAEDATNAAARSALWSFFGMLVGAIVCAFFGVLGARQTIEGKQL